MRLNPPRLGEILAGVSGLLLAFSLFLPWYRSTRLIGDADDVTGFEAFAVVDLYLLVVAAAGVGLLALELTQRTPAIAVAWAAIAALLGLIAVGLTLWRALDPVGGPGTEPVFALLGLAASAGLTVGCFLSMRDEGLGSPASPGVVEPLPAPPVGRERAPDDG